ncbi:unnamed protein product [Rotaria sp. Silwood1]|nr:unnamed protein product [Rotaria sp. Silwood1]
MTPHNILILYIKAQENDAGHKKLNLIQKIPKLELTINRIDVFLEERVVLNLFENRDTSLLRQTIHYDTSLYRLQATNECVTATSCFDILFQILLSSQCAPLQVNETKKDYVSFAWHTCSDEDEGELLSFLIQEHRENTSI